MGSGRRGPGGAPCRLGQRRPRVPAGPGMSGAGQGAAAGTAAVLSAALAGELSEAVRLRHELHADPELSGSEHRTAARMAAALDAADAPPVAGTGRLVRIGPSHGPCIAVRAELDALPVAEQTGAPWASRNGAMHACGHDVHMAALAALGRAARQACPPAASSAGLPARASAAPPAGLPAALLAVLQPSEEAEPSGARDIVASAADPVLALCQAVVTLQQIVSRRTDPTHGAVVSVGALEAGQAPNVIPAAAVARGTLRALDQADRAAMRTMLREIVQHVCLAHGCQGTVTIDEGEPALVNDESLAAASWPWLRQAGFTVDTSFRSCGSDDFAFYGATAPSLMMFIGAGSPVTLHHPRFLPDDDLVGQVASAMLAGYLGARGLLGGDRGQDELSPA